MNIKEVIEELEFNKTDAEKEYEKQLKIAERFRDSEAIENMNYEEGKANAYEEAIRVINRSIKEGEIK